MLALDGVHLHYGTAHVLHGVTLGVEGGQIACLVGRNGAGKSSTLKSIIGLVRPSAGAITFQGRRIEGWPPHRIAALGVAWVPEDRRVFGSLSVEENVRVAAQATRRAGAQGVRAALEFFPDLLPRARQIASSLSGGQQQMLAIARALVTRPALILLDEPTEGLAPGLVSAIRAGILAARARGISILLVEQNLALALAVGDVFYVLSRGVVAYQGGRDALAARPDVITEHLGVGQVKELAGPSAPAGLREAPRPPIPRNETQGTDIARASADPA
jgi:branched-chain amino acid transport system ATP-binding protein